MWSALLFVIDESPVKQSFFAHALSSLSLLQCILFACAVMGFALTAVFLHIKRSYYTLREDIPGIPPSFPAGNIKQLGLGPKVVSMHVFQGLAKQFGMNLLL